MADGTLQNIGHCRCGQVGFTVAKAPLITMVCHCTGCQRMTASAFCLSALFPNEVFTVTTGDTVMGGLHGPTRHYFCDYCKSWLFTRAEGVDQYVNVRTTLMENAADYRPFIETYTDEKLPWITTPAIHRFNKFPRGDQFPALIAEYAKWVTR